MTATNRAPAACASSPIRGIGSRSPRKSGFAAITPATGRSASAEHRFERGEVGRAGRVALGDQRDLVELEAAAEIGPQRARGSADGRRDSRAPGRGASLGTVIRAASAVAAAPS